MGRKSTTAWLILIDGLLLVRERAGIGIGVVILSIVAHGLTVHPLLERYWRKSARARSLCICCKAMFRQLHLRRAEMLLR